MTRLPAVAARIVSGRARFVTLAAIYVAGGIGVVITLIMATGGYLDTAFHGWFDGAFGSQYAATQTIQNASTLVLVALGASIALRAGIVSIGAEGQLIVGAIFAAAVAFGLGDSVPAWLALLLGVVAGGIGGTLWALFPAFAIRRWNVNEILFTLLMNYVATYLLAYLLRTALRDNTSRGSPQSGPIPGVSLLPQLPVGGHLHAGVILVAGIIAAMGWFTHTKWVFLLDVHRHRPSLAARAGMSSGRAVIIAFVVSGACAGIAGWLQLVGVSGRLEPNISAGLGFSGVAVAVLGRFNPLGVTVAGLFYASLGTGSAGIQFATGTTPAAIGTVAQGILLLTAALLGTVLYAARRDRGTSGSAAEPPPDLPDTQGHSSPPWTGEQIR
ncbi:MAG: ABC transporter permease [Gordonia sp. (in: high G+C Gram-positive bacteria)]